MERNRISLRMGKGLPFSSNTGKPMAIASETMPCIPAQVDDEAGAGIEQGFFFDTLIFLFKSPDQICLLQQHTQEAHSLTKLLISSEIQPDVPICCPMTYFITERTLRQKAGNMNNSIRWTLGGRYYDFTCSLL